VALTSVLFTPVPVLTFHYSRPVCRMVDDYLNYFNCCSIIIVVPTRVCRGSEPVVYFSGQSVPSHLLTPRDGQHRVIL